MKKRLQDSTRRHLQRILALLIPVLGIIGLILAIAPFEDREIIMLNMTDGDIISQNLGRTCIFLSLFVGYILKRTQGGAYWPSWLQLQIPVLDERQKQIRQQVFEQSYFAALLILFAFSSYINKFASYSDEVSKYALSHLIWVVGILLISLPSMMAAFRKDS